MNETLPSWNLKLLYEGIEDPALGAAVEGIVPAAEGYEKAWRGKMAGTEAEGFAAAIAAYEDFSQSMFAPYIYAHLRFSLDSGSQENVVLMDRVRRKVNEAGRKTLFFSLEPDEIPDEKYGALAAHPALKRWSHYLLQQRALKAHRLSEPEESVLALKSLTGRTAFVQLYSRLTAAMRFKSPEEPEKTITGPELLAFQKHPDREIRRTALATYSAEYEAQKLVLSSVWNTIAADHRQDMELRGFTHPMEATHLGNELSEKAVQTLMEVSRKRYGLAARYYRWKAGVLGLPKLSSCDLLAPLPGGDEEKIPFASAKEWVLDAFGDFSDEFRSIAAGFFDEGRIDAMPREGKSGGAFCMAVGPKLPVFVLMNYTGKLRDAATLAHELGHGIHFTLARVEPLLEYDPVLPMAETASVFGELLLTNRLMGRELPAETRRNLLAERVEDILATTFRQNMYTDFELEAHTRIAHGPLSPEEFCGLWAEKLGSLYGDSVEILEGSRWSWSAIPHFIHTRFYCYAYTFGELLVLALYRRYLEEGEAFAPKFTSLLKSGGSRPPADLARDMGYDLEDPEFWDGGYRVLEEMIERLEKGNY